MTEDKKDVEKESTEQEKGIKKEPKEKVSEIREETTTMSAGQESSMAERLTAAQQSPDSPQSSDKPDFGKGSAGDVMSPVTMTQAARTTQFAQRFTKTLSDAIVSLCRNRKFMNSLATALIALSGFIEKQTQNEHLPEEQQQAIVQIGTLGFTVFKGNVEKGSVWDKLTPTQVKGVFAESFKEFMGNVSKSGDHFDFRPYDDNVNMTAAEKDERDGKVLYEPFEKNPMKSYNQRRNPKAPDCR